MQTRAPTIDVTTILNMRFDNTTVERHAFGRFLGLEAHRRKGLGFLDKEIKTGLIRLRTNLVKTGSRSPFGLILIEEEQRPTGFAFVRHMLQDEPRDAGLGVTYALPGTHMMQRFSVLLDAVDQLAGSIGKEYVSSVSPDDEALRAAMFRHDYQTHIVTDGWESKTMLVREIPTHYCERVNKSLNEGQDFSPMRRR